TGAAASPSVAGFSSSLAFLTFLITMRWTRTFGRAYGLRPSCQRSSSFRTLIRSPRVSTLRARSSVFLRRRLLSIDMALIPGSTCLDSLAIPRSYKPDRVQTTSAARFGRQAALRALFDEVFNVEVSPHFYLLHEPKNFF